MGGAAVTEVQSLLGHASPAITLRIYTHWFKTTDSGAVGRLGEIILGTTKKWAVGGHSNDHAVSGHAINA